MSGTRQAPSGTPYDPLPQLKIEALDGGSRGRPAVLARCFFAPVLVASRFDRVTHGAKGLWAIKAECDVVVEVIEIYKGVFVDELDQVCSARLVLAGPGAEGLSPEDFLIGEPAPDTGRWRREGSMWVYAVS